MPEKCPHLIDNEEEIGRSEDSIEYKKEWEIFIKLKGNVRHIFDKFILNFSHPNDGNNQQIGRTQEEVSSFTKMTSNSSCSFYVTNDMSDLFHLKEDSRKVVQVDIKILVKIKFPCRQSDDDTDQPIEQKCEVHLYFTSNECENRITKLDY
ncbi:hypothetical protein EGR_07748 [Echinococcus granulosus]|uniref:Uncharacterized protein n=1 Tax=Echinococcus granulosus TaxID=6210 RepID=W6UVG1_ECHGR|nr:hypothetical protein EGR_07748 [Echinococcus granulosus]EUB57424.1 hypothetical protein EGR_07748 [Echinococcus granulosus]